jgi:hypothetical protein
MSDIDPRDALEYVSLIDDLRSGQGWSVRICDDNFYEGLSCCVECEGSWIKHSSKSFYGDTVLDCLRAAYDEMTASIKVGYDDDA